MNYALLHVLSGGLCLAVTLNAITRRGGVAGIRLALVVFTGGASLVTIAVVSGRFVPTALEAVPYLAVAKLGVAFIVSGSLGIGVALWSKEAVPRRVEWVTVTSAALFSAATLGLMMQLPLDRMVRSTVSWHAGWLPLYVLEGTLSAAGATSVLVGAARRLRSPSAHGRRSVWAVLAIHLISFVAYLLMRLSSPHVLQAGSSLLVAFVALGYWLVLHRWRFAGVADSALVLLFEQTPTPSVMIDLQTDRALLNPAAQRLFSGSPGPDQLAHRLGLGDTAEALLNTLGSQTASSVRILGVDHRVFDLHCHFDARRGIGLLLLNEVTERVAHAEELARTLGALRQAQHQLVMQEKIAALGVVVAGVNHEINNPLAYVTANLQALQGYLTTALRAIPLAGRAATGEPGALGELGNWARSPEVAELSEDGEAALREAAEGCARIGETVASMRMLSRKEDTEQALDLSEVARAGLKIGRTTLSPSVEVVAQVEAPLPVRGGSGELSRVVTNLVVNAGQAMGPEGRLTVRSFREGALAVVEVADDGPGVSPELRSRIFEPFFTTKQPGVGTGLGLAIGYETLRRHGGELVLCASERGACFQLRVPLTDAREEPEPAPLEFRRPASAA